MKFLDQAVVEIHAQSRPARGAWVEITSMSFSRVQRLVAPRKGRVG